ncbi:hypothetical protein VA249_29830 [Vibrio alfacsensis]|uniref:DUF968 domain-containing protein n=1 Tax=Vibrio alfacsensis TaxID=1074311 RepID=UPI001BEFA8E3|nr:DUF968 domain-containing protein [Vibrio alfacsensis]BBM66337.1 hypothetical protein VA249_29830 [Vibrio alfacsensis]
MLVLQPFLQADLGLMMFKPGKALLGELALMSEGNRLVVMPLPKELVNVPSGKLKRPIFPESSTSLVEDDRLVAFFKQPEVQKRLGNFYHWLERIPHCQLSDGEYCDKNLTFLDCAVGAIRLCWHHDNQERVQPTEKGREIAKRNFLLWGLEVIQHQLRSSHPVTLPELCWWSVVNGVYEHLPVSIVDQMYGVKPKPTAKVLTLKREADERDEADSKALLIKAVKAINITVDDEPPAMFMARPKEKAWHSEKYLKFVRSLPCVITHKTEGVVAHHLIGHGEGKMGGKAHDLFTMPLSADEHQRFHHDPKAWEAKNGSQLFYVKQTIKKALELGALV